MRMGRISWKHLVSAISPVTTKVLNSLLKSIRYTTGQSPADHLTLDKLRCLSHLTGVQTAAIEGHIESRCVVLPRRSTYRSISTIVLPRLIGSPDPPVPIQWFRFLGFEIGSRTSLDKINYYLRRRQKAQSMWCRSDRWETVADVFVMLILYFIYLFSLFIYSPYLFILFIYLLVHHLFIFIYLWFRLCLFGINLMGVSTILFHAVYPMAAAVYFKVACSQSLFICWWLRFYWWHEVQLQYHHDHYHYNYNVPELNMHLLCVLPLRCCWEGAIL